MDTLTIKDIEKAIEELKSKYIIPKTFVKSDILIGTQTILECGDQIYYPSDIKDGEIKIIKIPQFDTTINYSPDIKFSYSENLSVGFKYPYLIFEL